jgi:creatinine amidohydrolase
MIVEICRGLARFGPKRFYVLNTGVSTVSALAPAAEILAANGILLRFANVLKIIQTVRKSAARRASTHAGRLRPH